MSEELNKELTKLIAKAAIDGTLSENAVKQFTEVLEENKTLTDKVNRQDLDIKKKDVELTQTKAKLSNAQDAVKTIEEREKACEESEREHRDRMIQLECANLRVEDHIGMVTLIFRNDIMRKTLFGQELTHQPGSPEMKDQYGNIQQYHTPAGFEATPVKKESTETKE